ncbi:ABC transporter substrate-binding protein [Paraburkholderia caballeronis]|uniref:Iron(III) transport system substrate-binding protein n=1 Tax=Paraburkholderia caballeronis TaxID=416943 RepID=A0A1H7MSE4_9BURK|nr:ABC transporter substrate-binding protein [Paraburkholderia caballeronis]PXW26436.1 iron(III) transport system substrate-binding protein [Paraburkholderia caballeronis]PXX01983.1 iron(III) transport system substrate-binding protein [Paraburkholderia caballeronis]RAK01140.1 iron(III) transport system substrate-binding protein [Paraburkholderia caballeronis]SEB95765.1 iron(III) transport system substrate-binding protein [Paraburkholderia caballeronis]SEL14276.1 iron(III) transport system subs
MRFGNTFTSVLSTTLLVCSAIGTAHAGQITVYSALESDEIATYIAAAKKALPDLQVNVLRLSTGDLAARMIAEASAPHADAVWGEALTNLLDPRIADQLAPVQGGNISGLPKQFKDPGGKWFAATGYMAALCVNTDALAAKKLPMPTSWEDLAKPVYKGNVVMPDPASSGTGYLQIAAILQGAGEDQGWKILKGLGANVAQFTSSGSQPCKLARTGEYAVGASFAFVAMQSIKAGFPVKMVIPSKYVGYELEGSGMLKTSKNQADTKRFLEWVASPEAAKVYQQYKEIVTTPGVKPTQEQIAEGLPVDVSKVLYPMDFTASAKMHDAVLRRFKTEVMH